MYMCVLNEIIFWRYFEDFSGVGGLVVEKRIKVRVEGGWVFVKL